MNGGEMWEYSFVKLYAQNCEMKYYLRNVNSIYIFYMFILLFYGGRYE